MVLPHQAGNLATDDADRSWPVECSGPAFQLTEMFGSIYASHPDVLRQSLRELTTGKETDDPALALEALQRAYVRLLGIPEIGFRLRAMYFSRALAHRPSPHRVLDAGCGIGAYSLMLARRYPLAEVVGCDIDKTKTAFCNELRDEIGLANVRFVEADVTDLADVRGQFDLILCIDVLEHVEDYRAALASFHRVLGPEGDLYVHVPRANQERLFRRFDHWQLASHVRDGFSGENLAWDFQQAGFDVERVTPTFGFLGKLAWELNHLTLQWNLGVAGAVFPMLFALAGLDHRLRSDHGLGLLITARKSQNRRVVSEALA